MRRSFEAITAFLLTVGFVFPSISNGQDDHFIGTDQNVNRVIQLQSTAKQAVERVAKTTSRTVQDQRSTTVANPEAMAFDEIGVPRALQQPMKPVVQNQAPRTQTTPTVNQFTPQVQTQNSWAKPASSTTWPKPSTTTTQATTRTTTPTKSYSSKKVVALSQSSTLANWISAEISAPKSVNVGKTSEIQIKLKNESKDSSSNVKLVTRLPQHAKLVSASPQAAQIEGNLYEFSIPRLAGQEDRTITLQVIPQQKQPLTVSTQVTAESTQRTTVAVLQPDLRVSFEGPRRAVVGQSVTHKMTITNVGDGPASNVRLDMKVPEQFRRLEQTTGSVIPRIEPGKTTKVTLKSMAMAAGQAQFAVSADAEGVDKREASQGVRVVQPELRISAYGPKLNFVKRDGLYTIAVENSGEVEVTNVRVSLSVPQGMKVTTISREANVDATRGILTWSFEKIPANSKESIQMKTLAIAEGTQVCNILVSSKQTRDKELQLATKVTSRADMSVRIRNQSGPVEVGGKAEFLVEVENNGSRQAQDVSVRVELPPTLAAVRSEDSLTPQFENGFVFNEPSVAPGKKVTFKFSVTGAKSGEHVVRSQLQTGQSQNPMIAEDTIYVYEVDEARVSESLSPAIPRR